MNLFYNATLVILIERLNSHQFCVNIKRNEYFIVKLNQFIFNANVSELFMYVSIRLTFSELNVLKQITLKINVFV